MHLNLEVPKLTIRVAILASFMLALGTVSEALADQSANNNLRYFVVEGSLAPPIAGVMVENPANPMAGAQALVASIEGAKLIDYFLFLGEPKNLAIIAVPNSDYAAAITYQRFGTQALSDIKIREVIPGSRFEQILKISNELANPKE